MTVPSFIGVMPMSDDMTAFSMAWRLLRSQGVMTSWWPSAALTAAIWLTGVGTP